MIIGICGNKSHGKDTIANYLVEKYDYVKLSFGDPLKKALREIFGFSDEQLWGSLKDTPDSFWQCSPRDAMQFIGTELFRDALGNKFPYISKNIWIMSTYRNLVKEISSGHTHIVIADVRFQDEAKFIKELNGYIIRVQRPSVTNTDHHISENLFQQLQPDYQVCNETIDKLYGDVDDILRQIPEKFV